MAPRLKLSPCESPVVADVTARDDGSVARKESEALDRKLVRIRRNLPKTNLQENRKLLNTDTNTDTDTDKDTFSGKFWVNSSNFSLISLRATTRRDQSGPTSRSCPPVRRFLFPTNLTTEKATLEMSLRLISGTFSCHLKMETNI